MLRRPDADIASRAADGATPSTAETIAFCDDLRYSSDGEPGITRRRAGKGFVYYTADGRRISDERMLERIRKLAIPPAYRNVWICRDPQGHLQATGIDARGRKQYRYHPRWRTVRDTHKFERMTDFGRALPRIHRRISADLKRPGIPREKVLATIVRLLERTLIRVGNVEYARTNRSYGLTTMRKQHVTVRGTRLKFRFRGKHGIEHEVEVDAPRSARVVRKCLDLPGQQLFEYVDENGDKRKIMSTDVNEYLQEIAGEEFSAKDFRTWHATSAALEALAGQPFRTAREAKDTLKSVLVDISGTLGNTPTMCRKCYINPVVIDAFLAGELRTNGLKRAHDQRARLLQLLTRTPSGAGFGQAQRAPRKRKSIRRKAH